MGNVLINMTVQPADVHLGYYVINIFMYYVDISFNIGEMCIQ